MGYRANTHVLICRELEATTQGSTICRAVFNYFCRILIHASTSCRNLPGQRPTTSLGTGKPRATVYIESLVVLLRSNLPATWP
jgi:hypothetical protein